MKDETIKTVGRCLLQIADGVSKREAIRLADEARAAMRGDESCAPTQLDRFMMFPKDMRDGVLEQLFRYASDVQGYATRRRTLGLDALAERTETLEACAIAALLALGADQDVFVRKEPKPCPTTEP